MVVWEVASDLDLHIHVIFVPFFTQNHSVQTIYLILFEYPVDIAFMQMLREKGRIYVCCFIYLVKAYY